MEIGSTNVNTVYDPAVTALGTLTQQWATLKGPGCDDSSVVPPSDFDNGNIHDNHNDVCRSGNVAAARDTGNVGLHRIHGYGMNVTGEGTCEQGFIGSDQLFGISEFNLSAIFLSFLGADSAPLFLKLKLRDRATVRYSA